MLELSLIGAALLLGLGGLPHCIAMCATPCAAITRGQPASSLAFHAARTVGYMTAGAIVAVGVSNLVLLRELAPLTRPLWALLHAAVLVLGAWMLVTGRQPEWRWGRAAAPVAATAGGGWIAVHGPRDIARSGALGLAWVAWPCGLLQSALLLAALAPNFAGGAAVMGTFALASTPALWAGARLMNGFVDARWRRWSVRLAGGLIIAASAWTVGHRVAEWCTPAASLL
jgi:sulfite exporter TauE/SafE